MVRTARSLMHHEVRASYLHRRYLLRQLIFGNHDRELLGGRLPLGLRPKPQNVDGLGFVHDRLGKVEAIGEKADEEVVDLGGDPHIKVRKASLVYSQSRRCPASRCACRGSQKCGVILRAKRSR